MFTPRSSPRVVFGGAMLSLFMGFWSADKVFSAEETGGLRFTARCLMVNPNEGCAIGDINNDGKPDIVAGTPGTPRRMSCPGPFEKSRRFRWDRQQRLLRQQRRHDLGTSRRRLEGRDLGGWTEPSLCMRTPARPRWSEVEVGAARAGAARAKNEHTTSGPGRATGAGDSRALLVKSAPWSHGN